MSSQVGAASPISPRNNIIIRGNFVRKEGFAGESLKPGNILQRDTTNIEEVNKFATTGGNTGLLLALEEDYYGGGNDAGLAIDQAYAANTRVRVGVPAPGSEAWVRVATANQAAISIGDDLQCSNDGTVMKHTPQAVDEGGAATFTQYNNAIVGKALSACVADADTGSTDYWVRVEF